MILKPDFYFGTVLDINYDELKKCGIKALLFDLDSTIMPSKSGVFPPEVLKMLDDIKREFTAAVISNNTKEEYLNKARSQTDIEIIGRAAKPNPKVMLEYLKSKGIAPHQAAMIGDRPLTDILGGKLAGAKTVLTDSITKDTENFIVKSARMLERLFIRFF